MDQNNELVKRVLKRGYFTHLPQLDTEYPEEVRLWRTVMDMALADLLRGESGFNDSCVEPEDGVSWAELTTWFDPSNEDFQAVCEYAQLEPHIAYRKMDEIVYMGILPERLQ